MKPPHPARNGVRNRLLGRLPAEDFQCLKRHLEAVDLTPCSSLYEARVPFAHVYFPETGVGSIVSVLNDGTETEVAAVGQEGMVGLPVIWDAGATPQKALWQVAGTAWRLPAGVLRAEMERRGALRETLNLYT